MKAGPLNSWPHIKMFLGLLVGLALAGLFGSGLLLYATLMRGAVTEEHLRASEEVKRANDILTVLFREQVRSAVFLAGDDDIREALATGDRAAALDAVNYHLDLVCGAIEDSVCYVMDAAGITIASSNRGETGSFLGKNYAFRPYFAKTMTGAPAIYMAVGVTSGSRGIYYSHPVYGEGGDPPLGVVVVKVDAGEVEKALLRSRYGPIFVTSPEGMIFMSSRPEMLHRFFLPPSQESLEAVTASHQFGDGPFEGTGLVVKSDMEVSDPEGETFTRHEAELACCQGWRIVLLHENSSLTDVRVATLLSAGGLVSGSLLLVTIAGITVFYRSAAKAIGDRAAAETALGESEKRFRAVTQSALDAIVSADGEGRIVHSNEAAERMFGYGRGEMVGSLLTELMPERFHEAHREGMGALLAGGEPKVIGRVAEMEALRRDGSAFPVELSLSSWMSGDETCFTAIIRDIAERRKAELLMRKAKEQLEEKVQERTVELAETNLRLLEMDELKNMFVASMSHELRTPLNAIIGFTGVILQGLSGEISDEQRKQLTMVKQSADHLLTLVNEIIDVNRIQAGGVSPRPEDFDVADMVRDLGETCRGSASARGIDLSVSVPAALGVHSDPQRVRQVVTYLLENAVKFTPGGRVEIRVAREGGWVEIAVRDTGEGIDEKNLEAIFQPFGMFGDTAKSDPKARGLGLYLARTLAIMLGGSLNCQSIRGEGSEFVFLFPTRCGAERGEDIEVQ